MGRNTTNTKLNKRTRIIDGAIEVFAKMGFYNAKISMIAKAAGVADGTIYLYFKSKDDLLISIFEEKMKMVMDVHLGALADCDSATTKLQTFARVHLNLIKNNPALAELLQIELRQSTKFMKDYHHERFLSYLNIIGDIIYEGIDSGEFRSDINISVGKIIFFGALDEFATQWILNQPKNISIEEAGDQICKMFISGLKK